MKYAETILLYFHNNIIIILLLLFWETNNFKVGKDFQSFFFKIVFKIILLIIFEMP